MPYDITMCPGGECPLRLRCFRHRGVPLGRQDWFGTVPFDVVANACEHFWDIASLQPTDDQIRERAYWIWVAAGRPEGHADAHWKQAREELQRAADEQLRPLPAQGT